MRNIKKDTKLLMKKKPRACSCDSCEKFSGKKVTFKEWSTGAADDIDEKTPFFIRESENTLFFENVEKVLDVLPEELFKI